MVIITATRDIKTRFQLDGEKEYKESIKSVNSTMKELSSEMKLAAAEFKGQANTVDALTAKDKILREEIEQQTAKVKAMQEMYDKAAESENISLEALNKYKTDLNNAKTALIGMNDELDQNSQYLDEAKKSSDGTATSIDEYGKAVVEAEDKTLSFGDVLKANLTSEAIISGVKALASAVASAAKSAAEAIGDTAELGDNIDKQSQKLGISAEAYQEWDFILQHSGTDIGKMEQSMKTLTQAVDTGKDGFEKLGISLEEAGSMSQEDLFAAVITGLQGMEEGSERTVLAQQLLGEGAMAMGALLNTSAEDTEAMRQQIHDLGGVMSDEAVKGAAAYQDSLQNMKTALSGVKAKLSGEFLPAVSTMMDGVTAIMSGNIDEGMELITQGMAEFQEKIEDLGPVAMEGIQLIVSVLADNAPMLIEAAGQIVLTLVDGLAQNIPELIPVVTDIVLQIVDSLVDNVDLLIEAALQLIVGLAVGLVEAIPKLIEKGPEIVSGIKRGLIDALPQLKQAGIDLIDGLWNGIKESGAAFYSKIQGWATDNIVSPIKDFFGIASPSKLMRDEIGKNLGLGVTEGFVDAIDANAISSAIPSSFDIGASVRGMSSPAASIKNNVTIEFTGDLAQLGRVLQPVINNETARLGGSLVIA